MYKIPVTRKYPRIEKHCITRFQIKSKDEKNYKDWDMIAIVNLSAGGIFFYTIEYMEIGSVLDLNIGLSHVHPSITCVGKVIRAKKHLDTSVVGIAIEFTEIDTHMRKTINNTVKEYIKQNNQSSS